MSWVSKKQVKSSSVRVKHLGSGSSLKNKRSAPEMTNIIHHHLWNTTGILQWLHLYIKGALQFYKILYCGQRSNKTIVFYIALHKWWSFSRYRWIIKFFDVDVKQNTDSNFISDTIKSCWNKGMFPNSICCTDRLYIFYSICFYSLFPSHMTNTQHITQKLYNMVNREHKQ